MTSLAFDTHASVKKLKDAGFTEQQAEAQVQVLSEAIAGNLATKLDIAEVKSDLKADIAELKTEIAVVRTEIERMGRTIVMWMAGLAIAAVIGMTGILIALLKAMVPGA